MGLTVKETGGGNYSPIEAGTYAARCVGVIDLGIQHNDYNGKDQERVRLVFELPTERTVTEAGEDKPRWMSKPYTASLHEKATLRKELEAWRGKPFTAEELAGFNLGKLVGVPCLLNIVTQEGKNGGVFAKIASIGKAMKGQVVPPLENPSFIFDMDASDEECKAIMEGLPNWMQEEIKRSITWQGRGQTKPVEDGNGGFEDLTDNGEQDGIPF